MRYETLLEAPSVQFHDVFSVSDIQHLIKFRNLNKLIISFHLEFYLFFPSLLE